MIIDMHCHWIPPELAQMLRSRRVPPFIDGEKLVLPDEVLRYSPVYEDLAQRRVSATQAGITQQVLSLPSLFGIDALPLDQAQPMITAFNDGLAEQVARTPDAVSGLAAVPLADLTRAADEVDRAAAMGLRGIILPDTGFLGAAQAMQLAPVLNRAQAHGMCVFVHPGDMPDANTPTPAPKPTDNENQRHIALAVQARLSQAMTTLVMSDLLDRFPDLRVYVANLGGSFPFLFERMVTVAQTRGLDIPNPKRFAGRLAVDTASFGPGAIGLAVHIFGAQNVVFGTDDPVFPYQVVQTALNALTLTADDRQAILSGNAQRLLRG